MQEWDESQSGKHGGAKRIGAVRRGLAAGRKRGRMGRLEDSSMNTEPSIPGLRILPVPPSYEECVAKPSEPRADYVIPPLAMAALFAWEEDEEVLGGSRAGVAE